MAKNETLHIRVNETVKDNAEATLNALGISIADAVNMFLCQVNLVGGLPFEVKLPAAERVIAKNNVELMQKLNEAEDDIMNGRTSSAEEVFGRLRDKYGIQN